MLQRQLKTESSSSPHRRSTTNRSSTADSPAINNTNGSSLDEFRVLHPSLDANDETGELSRLLLSKWSIDAGEDTFASISLFCEVKFNEAKRMAAWVEAPNQFFATVCCQLLAKYIDRIAATNGNGNLDLGVGCSAGNGNGLGHSAELLRRILEELGNAIFLPAKGATSSCPTNYDNRVPYFTVRVLGLLIDTPSVYTLFICCSPRVHRNSGG